MSFIMRWNTGLVSIFLEAKGAAAYSFLQFFSFLFFYYYLFFKEEATPLSWWQLRSHGGGWGTELIFWQSNDVLICWCQQRFFIVEDSVVVQQGVHAAAAAANSVREVYYFQCTLLLGDAGVSDFIVPEATNLGLQRLICECLKDNFASNGCFLTPRFK